MVRKRPADASALTMPAGRRIARPADAPAKRSAAKSGADPLDAVLAKSGAELSSLASAVRACDACVRASDRRCFGSGHPRARVMLVKDRPSDADLRAGTSFVDEAPSLERAFVRLGIPLWDVYATTAVRCASRAPTADELRACAAHLLAEVEAVEPRVMVAFGERAADAIRTLDGRCGIEVPAEVERGVAAPLRPRLELLWTEALPEGITEDAAKRRLWRDLQLLPGMLQP